MFFASATTAATTALLFAVCIVLSNANCLTITTAEQLITFANSVNNGTSYYGTTVYLGSDIDFTSSLSQQFEPIGKNETKYFQGTFDGKGYTIKNLVLNPSLGYVGLFGYSGGATIKNLVIDSSCSILSTYSSSSTADVGGIVGYCISCSVESIVNMANITFTGSATKNNFFMAGIAGRLLYASTIRNCVNYGSITHSGDTTGKESNIGGIAALCGSDGAKYIQNCANYGTITFKGTAKTLYIGGIVGNCWAGTITVENCMSCGAISSNTQSDRIGSIVGYIFATTTITNCLWTSDVGYNNSVGSGTATISDSSLKELNSATMTKLKEYAAKNSTFSSWFILHLNGGRINNLNQET